MKKLFAFMILINLFLNGLAQEAIYPEGDIQLGINDAFGNNTNWQELSTANESLYTINYRNPASFTVSHDGKIYLINNIQKELQLFDEKGNFVKSLAKITDISKYRLVTMGGILDEKYIVTQNYDKLHIFNLDGSLFKILKLDYPAFQVVALENNVVAIYASVVYTGTRIKSTIILKNIITNKDKELEFHIKDLGDQTVSKSFGYSIPYSNESYIINRINNNELLVGFTKNPELKIYDSQGKLISTFDTKIIPVEISDSVRREFQSKVKEQFYKAGYKEQYDKNPVSLSSFPSKLPYFHSIQVDDNNNILVFLYTEEKKGYTASIYSYFSGKGQYLGTSTFNSKKYNLNLNPSLMNIKFGNKQIYAIVREGEDQKSPFRLVKFTTF